MRKTFLLVLIMTMSVVGLSACGSEEEAGSAGEKLVDKNCSGCHGEGLGGGTAVALDENGKGYSKDALENAINNGFDNMPAGLIEGDDVDVAVDYLLTIQPE